MMKKNKKKIIVEGRSDKIFLDALLSFLNIKEKYDVTQSGKGNKCEITNKRKIRLLIEDAFDDGYEEVIIVIDKETQLKCGVNYDCILELKDEYRKMMKIPKNVKIVVVDREIECWYVVWNDELKNYYKDCISQAFKIYKINQKSKITLAQRAVRDMEKILKYNGRNRSFEYFLNIL